MATGAGGRGAFIARENLIKTCREVSKKWGHTEMDDDLKVPQTRCKNRTKNTCLKEKVDRKGVIPARLLFPCPLEVLRVLGYPEEIRIKHIYMSI